LTTVCFGIILIVIGLIITDTGSISLIARRRGRERTEKVSSSSVRMEKINNEEEEGDDRFTPNHVLIYCSILILISAILLILIDSLRLLSMAASVFVSITTGISLERNFINDKRERRTNACIMGN
jgi:hypothetical protein